MKPENVAILVSLLQALKGAAEGTSQKPPADRQSTIDKLKQAAADAPYFNRFPDELHSSLQEIVHPPTAAGESLLIACVWIAKLEERLDKQTVIEKELTGLVRDLAGRLDMEEKRRSTLEARLSGQRDRMSAIEYHLDTMEKRLNAPGISVDEVNARTTDAHARINASNERIGSLETLVIGDTKGEDECCDPAIPTPIGTKRSDNV